MMSIPNSEYGAVKVINQYFSRGFIGKFATGTRQYVNSMWK